MVPNKNDQSAVMRANAAINKLLQLNYDREFKGPKPSPPTERLYHYTTADGLKGIVESNELWATSAYFLNDSAEVTYGCALLKDAFREWLSNNQRPEDSFSQRIAREFQKWFGEDLFSRSVISPIYLVCFCEDDNLLSQWRTYGQSGGYSIGFEAPSKQVGVKPQLKPEPNTYTSKLIKVIYDRTIQAERCRSLISSVLSIFDDADVARAINSVPSDPLVGNSRIRSIIADMLLEEIVGFKNQAFEIEKEWRMVVRPRELTKQGTDDGGRTPTPVYFRSARGRLVPYVKLIPTIVDTRIPVASVRSGPTLDKATTGMATRMMLDQFGFLNVRVDGSDIPVIF